MFYFFRFPGFWGGAISLSALLLTACIPHQYPDFTLNCAQDAPNLTPWSALAALAGDGVVNYAPFPASPLSPTPGATVTPTEGKVTISWESGDADGDALTYTLYADAVDGAQSPVASNVTTTTFALSVQAGTVYYWRVVANDGKNTATSILYTFKTAG